jgi:hypothetical protein
MHNGCGNRRYRHSEARPNPAASLQLRKTMMTTQKATGAALLVPAMTAMLAVTAQSSHAATTYSMRSLAQTHVSYDGTRRGVAYLHGLPTVIRPDVAAEISGRKLSAPLGRHTGGANPDAFPWPNYVYTCQPTGNDCTQWSPTAGLPPFTQGAPLIIPGLLTPVGTIVNTQGKWWIANEGASNLPFFTGATTGILVAGAALNDPFQLPVDVDANLNGNLVAVANIFTTSGGNGNVSVFLNGLPNPAYGLAVPTGHQIEGIGIMIDKPGNCFFSYNDLTAGVGHIVKFRKCKGKALPVAGLPPIGGAGGMAMDGGQHNLYYVDQVAASVFKCTGEVGPCAPLSTGYVDPVYINFDPGWQHLWVSDPGMNAANGALCYISAPGPIPPANCFATAGLGDPPVGVAPAAGSLY